ncbi:MAG: hypothetical protein EGQ03_03940 [Collinsella aerofaciens]|nr:hypothetical protein [Collinsella aerofaciens]
MEIVTGKAGVPHVSSADDGRRIAGEVGTGSYVLQTGGKLAPSLVDADTVRIATGDMIVQGRHIGVTAPEDVKVASGSQGKKRMDYICVHYTRDVSGSSPTLVETVEWKVLQGTPGSSAAAPSVPKGSILDGDADVTVPICSVTFDGLTTGQPKLLIPELTPLADLGDSVSPRVVAQTSTGKLYQPFRCELPLDRMAALVCIYDNGRPLASTVFPISIFARYCTGSGVCADCYYSPGGFGVHAYYVGGMLYLMADANIYKAAFVVL